jgi:Cof subfamily protein (haloacid dehalogenase superfamily)
MKIRAVCTDIDGTLLNSKRELSDKTIAAFKSIDKSIPVILASSRMPSAMTHLQRELGILYQPLICFNGGYVIQYKEGEEKPFVCDTVQIPIAICAGIVDLARGTDIHVSLYHEDNWYAPQQDHWTEREARITKVDPTIQPITETLADWRENNKGGHKVMCMGHENDIHALETALRKTFGGDLHIYRSKSTYLEIAPRIISKATALQLVLEKFYNLNAFDAIAFGDNYNDIEMIAAAGLGVAVDNARDEVKAVAKEITLKSVDDGVAISLRKHFLVAKN